MIVTLTDVAPFGLRDTVIPFEGTDATGRSVLVGVDHRMGWDIIEALDDGPVEAQVEPWQVLGVAA